MYFKLHDRFFPDNQPRTVTVRVVWYDVEAGSIWKRVYDAGAPAMKTAFAITGTGDKQWHDKTVTLTDAVMARGGTRGSDLALVNTDDRDDIFSIIEVSRGIPQAIPVAADPRASERPAPSAERAKKRARK